MAETMATTMSTTMPNTTVPKTMAASTKSKGLPTTTITSVTEVSDEETAQPSANSKTGQSLVQTIFARHTTRVFHKHIPVSMNTIEQCLSIAQHSPSSTNVQPWRLTFTKGAKLEKLREAMHTAAQSGPSTVPPIPDKFKYCRSDLGHILYGPQGYNIPRSDKKSHREAQLRNYKFFDAPLVAVVGIDESLMQNGADIMSVGLYLQTLVLLLTERGLATSMQVSTSGYAQVLRQELGIPENIFVLCTLSIGYEDTANQVNTFEMPRNAWRDHVNFVME